MIKVCLKYKEMMFIHKSVLKLNLRLSTENALLSKNMEGVPLDVGHFIVRSVLQGLSLQGPIEMTERNLES